MPPTFQSSGMVWRSRRSGPLGTCAALAMIGEGLGWLGCLCAYAAPFVLARIPDAGLRAALAANARAQACVFAPTLAAVAATGHMVYVDVAWPLGVVLLGARAAAAGTVRGRLVGCAVLLQGGRLLVGAVSFFGTRTKFTFQFAEDLQRYRYAEARWSRRHAPAAWPLKRLVDAATQGFATAAVLAPPVLLFAADGAPLDAPAVAGLGLWAAGFCVENLADLQKAAFARTRPPAGTVLGVGAGPFWLWRRCRHPNYFGEWLAWTGLAIAAAAPLARRPWGAGLTGGVAVIFALVPRFLYDCLVLWTGAEPAEDRSRRTRPDYRAYQASTRVLFPFPVPDWLVDHRRHAGWPDDRAHTA